MFLYIITGRHNGHDGVSNHQPYDCFYSTVYSGADQRKHQSSASLTFLRGIHRWPVNFPHKWPVTRKMFPFDDVLVYVWQTLWMLVVTHSTIPCISINDYLSRYHLQWSQNSQVYACAVSITVKTTIFQFYKSKQRTDSKEFLLDSPHPISTVLARNQFQPVWPLDVCKAGP